MLCNLPGHWPSLQNECSSNFWYLWIINVSSTSLFSWVFHKGSHFSFSSMLTPLAWRPPDDLARQKISTQLLILKQLLYKPTTPRHFQPDHGILIGRRTPAHSDHRAAYLRYTAAQYRPSWCINRFYKIHPNEKNQTQILKHQNQKHK